MSSKTGQQTTAPAGNLLQDYAAAGGAFDEMAQAPQRPRPHWRPLIESLQQLGRHELQSRSENGRRIIREHGVTYNVYGDPQGVDRPWGLDLVPFLIPAEEWARIEKGLIQRSRLFNMVLADIYGGSQRLLRGGFLPPELIFANPGFLRPCRGIPITRHVYLHLHACDLGRSPDGQWWVLSDRTQAPSGAGYAWENRTVVSRILPDEMRNCHVERVAGFFQQQREMLLALAPPGRNHPNVVLLTPGPHNETYFEHTYLARHLGFPLVEGADLTVRDRRVFLKTIEGLQGVDVILRRVDDWFCDPLELRGDSLLGISGLVEATRAGNVTLANALGAGLMESPAFLAFLPGLCRDIMGEELLLPSVATRWCGQGKELRYVTEHLDSLALRPAFAARPPPDFLISDAPTGRRKLAEHRKAVLQMLRAAPKDFVAQERIRLSRAPVWVENRFAAQAVVVRTYVANSGKACAVLPGGLTRISRNPNYLAVSTQSGSGSKDTWILSNGAASAPEPPPTAAEPRLAEHISQGVPSRAADHLFWLGRYTERLEQLLRVLRCILGRLAAEPGRDDSPERQALAELSGHLGLLPKPPAAGNGSENLAGRMIDLIYAADEPAGARELLKRVRAIASAVRDRFSGDTWRILGRLETDARKKPGRLPLASATELSHHLVLDLAAFSGMEMENMTRGRGWRFLDLGRRLERGLNVLKLVQAAVNVKAQPGSALEPVLEIADSLMTYRRQYFATPHLAGVLELVLRDDSNPRSLAFQVNVLREHAAALALGEQAQQTEAQPPEIYSLGSELRSAELNALVSQHAQGAPQPLLDLLNRWSARLTSLSDAVTNRYFSHSVARLS